MLSAALSPAHRAPAQARPIFNALMVQNRMQAQGVPLFILEVAVGGEPHVFSPGPTTHLLRSDSCLFQKERLLNVLEARVPARFKKLLLLDADVVLASSTSQHWYDTLSSLLESHDVVQPFDVCAKMDLGLKKVEQPRCSVFHADRRQPLEPQLHHNHPGYGWAVRRDWLRAQGGLFDLSLNGGGDTLHAAAFGGYRICWRGKAATPPALQHNLFCNPAWTPAVPEAYGAEYGEYYGRVQASRPRVTSAGTLMAVHHWHGSRRLRQLDTRMKNWVNVTSMSEVLSQTSDGIWELRTRESAVAKKLNESLCAYFRKRSEDDVV